MIQGVAARPRPASSDPLTDGTVRASDLLAAALAPAPRSVSVSWFAGQFASRPERVEGLDGAPYDLAALADDVRALVQLVRPKGEGAALCGAVFGDLDNDAPDLAAPRQIAHLRRATLVHLDVDGGATMGAVVAMLRAWGVAAVVWPSPSAVAPGLDAERVRALVQLVPDAPRVEGRTRRVHPASAGGRRVLVKLARHALPSARIDAGCTAAQHLAFVHPRGAARPASDVVLLAGQALDLSALALAAAAAGVIPPVGTGTDRHHASEYSADGLRELAIVAGLATHQGGRVTATECPVADTHSDGKGRGGRGDTSCAIGAWGWRCMHSHGGRGPLGSRELVTLALALVRDGSARERLDAMLHAAETPAARVTERLAAPAVEGAVDVVSAPDVPDLMRDVGRWCNAEQARAGRAAVGQGVPSRACQRSAGDIRGSRSRRRHAAGRQI